jgi:hypothetical protein
MKNLARWFASLPIAIVGANSIMLGTLLSAAEYDGWISWGHGASVVMLISILLWVVYGRGVTARR